jgi:hypothetical protein
LCLMRVYVWMWVYVYVWVSGFLSVHDWVAHS